MRPTTVETAVQCSVYRMWVFAGFSGHDNSNITLIPPFKYNMIYIYICVCVCVCVYI